MVESAASVDAPSSSRRAKVDYINKLRTLISFKLEESKGRLYTHIWTVISSPLWKFGCRLVESIDESDNWDLFEVLLGQNSRHFLSYQADNCKLLLQPSTQLDRNWISAIRLKDRSGIWLMFKVVLVNEWNVEWCCFILEKGSEVKQCMVIVYSNWRHYNQCVRLEAIGLSLKKWKQLGQENSTSALKCRHLRAWPLLCATKCSKCICT